MRVLCSFDLELVLIGSVTDASKSGVLKEKCQIRLKCRPLDRSAVMHFFLANLLHNQLHINVNFYMFDKENYFLLSKIASNVGQIIDAEH